MESEYRSQFPTMDVHVERFDADVQKSIGVGEIANLAKDFNGCGSVGNNDMHVTQCFKCADDLSQREKSSSRAVSLFKACMISTTVTCNLCASISAICERSLLYASRMD
jgi:hypothetical protein